MTGRDNQLWLQSWRDNQTDFHQQAVNQLLARFWPSLDLSPGSRVFVPLCGKSLDMIWLARQGCKVIGVELSPIAIRDFFRESGLKPIKQKKGDFTLWVHDDISILCGDYFSLDKSDLGTIDMVYDRAALTALPEDIRSLYIAQLKQLVPETTTVFLLTTEDAEEKETLSQALGVSKEITSLYSADFDIKLIHVDSVFEQDPESPELSPIRVEYKAYRLSSKPACINSLVDPVVII